MRLRAIFAWIAESALAERDRWPLWLPVAFGSGIGIYFSLSSEPSLLLAAAFGFSGLLLALAASVTETPFAKCAQALLASALIGFSLAKWRTDSVSAPILTHRLSAGVTGRVASVELRNKGVRVLLELAHAERLSKASTPKIARIVVRRGGEDLNPGDWISLRAVLLPPPEPAAPGAYDFGRSVFFQQIGAVGFAYGGPQRIPAQAAATITEQIETKIENLRWRISKRIRASLPGSTGSIAASLITGDRGGISDDDQTSLRDAGLAHVLAISGLNMALVGLGLFWTVRAILALSPFIALTQPIKKWAAVLALASTTFYLLISGASTPAIRAFLMLSVMLIAILFDRPALSMRSVAFAAIIVLALQPEALIEPGFQMSFAAVSSLIAMAEWQRNREWDGGSSPGWLRSIRKYLIGIAVTSLVGSLSTMPFAIYHFDRATHYAIIGNLIAMPLIGFVIMPAAAIAVLAMPLGLENFPLQVMGWGIEGMLAIGRWVGGLPGSISIVPAWPISALVLLTIGGLWIILWRGRWRWLGVVAWLPAVAVLLTVNQPDILVARDGVTIAMRAADGGLRLIRKPADKYSAEEWLKRDGDERAPADVLAKRGDGVNCDSYGCIIRALNGMRVAAVLKRDALEEDCAAADIVISATPTRHHCTGPPLVIDRFDVAHNGAYAIWLRDGIQIETARQARGLRPWSMPPQRQYRRMRPTSLP